ncbi:MULTISPECIES: hypothetical protein [Halomonas]|jgi:hypothetical protein|uniref:hypothetical protein n=1 Tax=Halomonas TaxID=2745 RepID=UPI0020B8C65C|nr:hypothetical protein [Halomonas sp. 3H]
MKAFLVDVFAIHSRGQEMHLGGGIFHAPSATEAESLATQEFWRTSLSDGGYDIGFQTDQPETGWQVKSLEHLETLKSLMPRPAFA